MHSARRDFMRALALILSAAPLRGIRAGEARATVGNFGYIYSDPATREEFKKFLANVFRLFPQDELHAIIQRAVNQGLTDRQVYAQVQARLDGIKPFLGDLRYSLPALSKQKRVLAEQTLALLDRNRRYVGYMEFGSNGRFLDSLEERLDVAGDCFTVSDRAPTNSPVDVVDRGQIRDAGTFIPLADYHPALAREVPARSVDLVTVYIGFHHCPVDLRQDFLGSIRRVLRPGGALIVRDHNVYDERMRRMVALAHDVFNMGTRETWQYNERERRNFYPLAELDRMLADAGFKAGGRRLLQEGDPTLNTLMRFTLA